MFMSILDLSIVNVALPAIQNEFGAATQDAQWVITGYSLAEGVVVPVSAWLGDRYGVSRVYNLALLGFAGGSALCGLAWNLDSLVIFRVVQGVLGGILPAITMAILLRIVPKAQLGTAIGFYGLGAVLAPTIGPALGGYLVEYVDWRLIFFINVPIAILGAVAAALVLPRFPGLAKRRFDVLGFVTVAGGLFALLLALSKGEDWGWDSYRILGLITFSVLSLALFVVIELEVDDPLLDLRVFRYSAFTHSLVLIALLSVVLFSVVFYVPQFLQRGQGLGAFDAGLTLLPPALVMGVFMPIAGQVYDRIGPRWPTAIGLTIAAVGTYLMHTITLDTSREQIMWMLTVQYTGLGIGMMPIFSAGLAVIPAAHANTASAVNNVVQRTAGALGVAACTAVLTAQQAQLMAGRAALLPSNTPTPDLGPTAPPLAGLYATYQQADLRAFAGAIDNLFLIFTALCTLTALGALLMRSGPSPAAPTSPAPPAHALDRSPSANGRLAAGHDLMPPVAVITADNGSSARTPPQPVDVGTGQQGELID
jgi:EmrB/QacA subfamily drug resistance transporter